MWLACGCCGLIVVGGFWVWGFGFDYLVGCYGYLHTDYVVACDFDLLFAIFVVLVVYCLFGLIAGCFGFDACGFRLI